jgi:RND family efflux transporter MFP subunit
MVSLGIAVIACERKSADAPPPIPSVKAIAAEISVDRRVRNFSGQVVAADSFEVAFAVGGRVIELNVNEGDDVREGDIVAKLDPATYRLALDSARAKLETERAALREAQDELGRKRTLFRKEIVARAAMDKAQSAYDSALGRVRVAESEYAQRQLDQQKTVIQSPMAGRVVERPAKLYSEVAAGQPIMVIGTQSELEVAFLVPETLIGNLALDQQVSVDLPAANLKAITATITQIAAVSGGGNAFAVRALLQDNGSTLRQGMTANVSLSIDAAPRPAFLLPISAFSLNDVSGEGLEAPIFVLDPARNRIELRRVEVGDARGNEVEVLSGIEPGELIVVSGVAFLRDGMEAVLWKPSE